MAGIYIHIPFCKQACHYCNFHFSTSLKYKKELIDALLQEISLQKHYLGKASIETIYLGGGTPSILTVAELNQIFEQLHRYFSIAPNAEITLEANPDDLTTAKIKALAQTPINRLSIGIQSFWEEDLKYMNRAHNAQEAKQCIVEAQQAGFQNLTIDFIYGTPTMSHEQWQANLQQAIDFSISHISAYCLTVEPKTALAHFIQKGQCLAINEEHAAVQFDMLVNFLTKNGYWHYEISNFCQPNQQSRHNTAYWQSKPYLGLGPSAHSFNGTSRQWNVAHNARYIKQIHLGKLPMEKENLTTKQRFNEYLMTSLRTMWGCDLDNVEKSFGKAFYQHLLANVEKFVDNKLIIKENDRIILENQGKFLADGIISDLMWISE